MVNQLVALIVDEGKWLALSMTFALFVVATLWYRHAGERDRRRLIAAAMNLFFALTIGTMAFGHLLAVTTKLLVGTLEGPALLLYVFGVVLAVPSWWLVHHAHRLFTADAPYGTQTVVLNVWVGAILLALGLHNLPLAVPALFNVGYLRYSQPLMGRVMLGMAIVVNAALFAGALAFLASGQTFEQFVGID
jgi:hypothetical protein